jgi:cobalt/nickel transport system ATP-binding protein
MKRVLEVANLAFSYDPKWPVLRDIGFAVEEGECLGIAGANGAGKTTLLWCLLGLHEANGSTRLFGEKLGKRALARVGVVFQNPEDQLFMPTVLEDVTLPLLNSGLSAGAAVEHARLALGSLGLEDVMRRPSSQLSFGERKRASIAAAMARSPELLLLDEPTAELDGRSIRQLAAALKQLRVTRIITSHHLEFLRDVTSRLLVLAGGKLVADAPTLEVLDDRSLLERAGLV